MIGAVEETRQSADDRFGLRIGDEWYYGPGRLPVYVGEQVTVFYSDESGANRVSRIEVWNPDRGEPDVWRGRRKREVLLLAFGTSGR